MKPPFRDVFVGADGRLWVLLHTPAVAVDVEPPADDGRSRIPPARWREPVVFDVFEPDGRYLGRVRAPDDFSTHPAPFFRGDDVWAVVRDELDVQYLVRFRVERANDRPERAERLE
ncbi:MAG TPA: hypothetical protein VF212_03825 [Longimicrobiales bacterium]